MRLTFFAAVMLCFAGMSYALPLKNKVLNQDLVPVNEAIAKNPKDPNLYIRRAIVFFNHSSFTSAAADAEKAIALDSKSSTAWFLLGGIRQAQQKYAAAAEAYASALAIDPKDIKSRTNRGESLFELKDYAGAEKDFAAAIELAPGDAMLRYLRGSALVEMKQFDRALADFDAGLKINPDSFNLHNARAWALLWLGKWEEAKAALDTAVKLNPEHPYPYANLANYFWAAKHDKDSALKNLRTAFEKGYDSFDGFYSDSSDGHFLKGLNETGEFRDLLASYRKKGK